VEVKEEGGNATAASYALDPPREEGALGFLGEVGSSGGDMGDPAHRAPTALALSRGLGQAQVQVVDREAEAMQDAGLTGGSGPIGRRTLDRAVRIITGKTLHHVCTCTLWKLLNGIHNVIPVHDSDGINRSLGGRIIKLVSLYNLVYEVNIVEASIDLIKYLKATCLSH